MNNNNKDLEEMFLSNPDISYIEGSDELVANMLLKQKNTGQLSRTDGEKLMNSYVCIVVPKGKGMVINKLIDNMRPNEDASVMYVDAYASDELIDTRNHRLDDRVYWVKVHDLGFICSTLDEVTNTDIRLSLVTSKLTVEFKLFQREVGDNTV